MRKNTFVRLIVILVVCAGIFSSCASRPTYRPPAQRMNTGKSCGCSSYSYLSEQNDNDLAVVYCHEKNL